MLEEKQAEEEKLAFDVKQSELDAAEAVRHHQMEHSRQGSIHSASRIGSIYKKTGDGIQTIRTDPVTTTLQKEIEEGDATWKDVLIACCCHSIDEWARIFVGIVLLLTCLYFFLLGLELLGTSFKVVGGCTAGSLLGSDTNPLAGVMIGIIATALLQSSSTTSAIIVSLVSGGLDVNAAIYMIMGANVGTR